MCQLLQHGSSLVGLVALLLSFMLLLRSPPKVEVPGVNSRWILLALVAVGVVMMNARLYVFGVTGFGHAVVATISGIFAGCLLAALVLMRSVDRLKCNMTRFSVAQTQPSHPASEPRREF